MLKMLVKTHVRLKTEIEIGEKFRLGELLVAPKIYSWTQAKRVSRACNTRRRIPRDSCNFYDYNCVKPRVQAGVVDIRVSLPLEMSVVL